MDLRVRRMSLARSGLRDRKTCRTDSTEESRVPSFGRRGSLVPLGSRRGPLPLSTSERGEDRLRHEVDLFRLVPEDALRDEPHLFPRQFEHLVDGPTRRE